jgi:hypothetical protein
LEPKAAAVRHQELFRITQSTEMERFPEPWNQTLLAEYEAMRQAAGVQTMQEQSEGQQQGMQAQVEAEANAETAKEQAMTERELATQAQQGEIDLTLQRQKSLAELVKAERESARAEMERVGIVPTLG